MDFARAAALAAKLIEKNGRLVKVQRLDGTAADSSKPWKGAGTPTVAQSVNARAAFLPHAGTDLGKFFVDEELLKRCEQVALVAGGSVNFTTFHQFEDGGAKWRIEWVRELKPATVSVLYVFGVKR